jgi:hypothetical protein
MTNEPPPGGQPGSDLFESAGQEPPHGAEVALIHRIEHTNHYVLTTDGAKFAIFYTKLHNRRLRPLLSAGQPQAPAELRSALRTIDHQIEGYITHARLGQAARKSDPPAWKPGGKPGFRRHATAECFDTLHAADAEVLSAGQTCRGEIARQMRAVASEATFDMAVHLWSRGWRGSLDAFVVAAVLE